jgi:hypothetical protein
MIKCKCDKCGEESTFEDHKSAWMAGWDFAGQKQYCGECPVMPAPGSNDSITNTLRELNYTNE